MRLPGNVFRESVADRVTVTHYFALISAIISRPCRAPSDPGSCIRVTRRDERTAESQGEIVICLSASFEGLGSPLSIPLVYA